MQSEKLAVNRVEAADYFRFHFARLILCSRAVSCADGAWGGESWFHLKNCTGSFVEITRCRRTFVHMKPHTISDKVRSISRTALDAAADYVRHRYGVVPIPFGQKAPQIAGWPKMRIPERELPQYYGKGGQTKPCLLVGNGNED